MMPVVPLWRGSSQLCNSQSSMGPGSTGGEMAGRTELGVNRRAVLTGGAAALAALGMPELGWAAGNTLAVSVYGGGSNFKASFEKHIFPGFTKATGIRVKSIARPSGKPWLTQLEEAARVGVAPADVSLMSQRAAEAGIAMSLWAPLDLTKIPNAAKVDSGLIDRYPNGQTAAIGGIAWRKLETSGFWAVSRVSRSLPEAHKFIDYMCRPDVQAVLSRTLGTAPTLADARP